MINLRHWMLLAFATIVTLQAGCSKEPEGNTGSKQVAAQKQGNQRIRSEFITAAQEGRIDAVRSFLTTGGDPNGTNDAGQTALVSATIGKRAEIVNLLLAHGADPNIADKLGQTPVFFAAYNQDLDVVEALIGAGANVNAMTQSGEFALLRAVVWGNSRLVDLLVKGGADVRLKPTDKRVPSLLKIATESQRTEIAATLKNAGATE